MFTLGHISQQTSQGLGEVQIREQLGEYQTRWGYREPLLVEAAPAGQLGELQEPWIGSATPGLGLFF